MVNEDARRRSRASEEIHGEVKRGKLADNKHRNGLDPETVLAERMRHYGLDYVEDAEEHSKNVFDKSSKWFSRDVKPKFPIDECLPYKIESHLEQAKYVCHILINLYVAINSKDIQGLISISTQDFAELKQDIQSYGVENGVVDTDMLNSDIADFDEGEYMEEQIDENEYIDLAGPDFNAIGKITSASATIVNVNYWTNELKNCMHIDFPLALRKKLASVYYYLSLVQGQKIYRQMHVEMFEQLVSKDDDGTNFTDLLIKDGLVLDYSLLFDYLSEFLPYPDSDYVRHDINSKDDLQLFRLLLKLAHQAKPFFNEKDTKLMTRVMDSFMSSLAPSTMSTVLPMITSFVPYHYHKDAKILDYFPLFFSLWSSVSANIAIDTHMYDFVGNISEDVHSKLLKNDDRINDVEFTKFGVFTASQLTFLFNRVQGHLRTDGQIHSYSRTVRPFVYCINGSSHSEYFAKLSSLVNSIETFVHPSNSGYWTKTIAKFIHGFIKMYHKRYTFEKYISSKSSNDFRLTDECHAKIVDTFVDILITGSQSKGSEIANYYISSFAYLLDLNPTNKQKIFDKILGDLYEALGGEYVHSRHRIISSLKQFTRIVRYMATDTLYRVHVTNILSMLVSKMDINDTNLTSNLINGIVSTASFIPFANMIKDDEYLTFESHTLPFIEQHYYYIKSEENNGQFQYDPEILHNAFRASTTIFENIAREYIDKLFQFISVDLEDGFISKINNTTMLMQESMDDKIFAYYSKKLLTSFWENDLIVESNPNYELLTIPLAALVKRDPTLCQSIFKNLAFNIRNQIEKGAGSIRSTSEIQQRDYRLVLYLTAMNDVIRQSYSTVLSFHKELFDFMTYIYDNITNPPIDIITSILSHSVLATLTTTEVVNSPLFAKDCKVSLEDRWGGMQFDDSKFNKDNLKFDWHVSTQEEVAVAIEFLENIFKYCKENTLKTLESGETGSFFVDKIQKYVLIMTHTLSGASLLFDPDFNQQLIKLNHDLKTKDMSSYKEIFSSMMSLNFNQSYLDEFEKESSSTPSTLNSEDAVEMKASSTDELVTEGEIDELAVQSFENTPIPGATSSSGEETAVFREIDIFACNYFFGVTTEEKFNNPRYLHVHHIRNEIGLFFHKLFTYLSKNFEDNTMIFQILLHGLKVWFTDVGQEVIFNEDQTAKLDLEFLENIQTLSHLVEPFTRTALSVKADNYHQSRVYLHSTIRKPSLLERRLLNDIVVLAASVYPDVSKPAQGTLVHCMKQLFGSYLYVIELIIRKLNECIKSNSYMEIEVVLSILMIKKIHRRLMSDYNNQEQIIILLIQCCGIHEMDIALYAEKILNDIVTGLKIPSSVCVIDENAKKNISPSDNLIDTQVSLIEKAKNNKRKLYLSRLSKIKDKLYTELKKDPEGNWKVSMFIVRFISKLEASLEFQSDVKSLEIIFEQIQTKHPMLIQLGIKCLLGIFNKILSLSDYKYDITRAYVSNFDPASVNKIDTSQTSFNKTFQTEMNKFENPSYFIDSRPFVGWLCWGSPMKVLQTRQVDLVLQNYEQDMLIKFSNSVTKEFLKELVSNFVKDNETKSIFSSGNVSFYMLVVYACSQEHCEYDIDFLFELCEETYDKYDKASMIMSVEIFSGLICGIKYLDERRVGEVDKFVDRFLEKCLFNELNQDGFEIWGTICWWLPTVVDCRRCPAMYKRFSDISSIIEMSNEDVSNQVSRINMFRNLLMGIEYKSPNTSPVLELLKFDNQHEPIREVSAKLLSTIIQNRSAPNYVSSEEVIKAQSENSSGLGIPIKRMPPKIGEYIAAQFAMIKEESLKVTEMTPQEILKSRYYFMASSMYFLLSELGRGPNKILLVPYIVEYVMPFLMDLTTHKDMCKISGLDPAKLYVSIAYMPIPRAYISDIINLICDDSVVASSFQKQLQMSLIQHFLSSQLLQLTETEKSMILEEIITNLYNSQYIEVRMRAAEVLSDIVHNFGDEQRLTMLIARFSKELCGFSWEPARACRRPTSKSTAVWSGWGPIVSAFPYVFPLPKWIPEQLSVLASWARTHGMAGIAAKNTISEFKKVRTDTWQFDRQVFSGEQLEDMEGALWRSYYA
ncbi:hypothetical protein TPHA_0P00350 [Tetrapisispora phaffii CBS 4417]|uniref:Proteasome activator Blm10 mid region domain-containing protein n=1 Tax=Tetrapisispora phaffii (strain ATCC 24235 / CBS 4417 / NBRC 1672 / NRRL Y-8282 / UCD 70-5) TaxID=1071381 RepID=G8C215_TETPH|nr:hypothetical protein TPHA_0P00350 [Tetrapisispora phaffii CBS 4417]CCE66193.1 hypothetical protein TPHA_0P00350 [Tetrapisispora phaffii CBS 4417]